MRRSVGVTISAVVVLIGSGFTALTGAAMLLGAMVIPKTGAMPKSPINFHLLLLLEAAVIFAFAGWGIATGVGLLKLKNWGRISILIYAAILMFVCIPAFVLILLVPFPTASGSQLPSNLLTVMRVVTAFIYGAFGALGGFWVYFFNRKLAKAQFRKELPFMEEGVASAATPRRRPLSITIIGWFFIAGSAMGPIFVLVYYLIFPGLRFPMFFLGKSFIGPPAILIFCMAIVMQLVSGVGLLKMKKWGLFASIGVQCVGILNCLLMVIVPANRVKFQEVMDTAMGSMHSIVPHTAQYAYPAWMSVVASVPIFFVILWFLVRERQAFDSDRPQGTAHLVVAP